jgi:uncharacterized membrane protein AbrB (regulator of aidB expression)
MPVAAARKPLNLVLCPSIFTVAYLGPSLLALKTGGLSLVFGMTVFAGCVESALSRSLRHLRAFFPPEIAGLVVVLLGVTIGEIMDSEDGHRRLAGFMLRRYADRVRASFQAGRSTILFHFDH